MANFDFFGGPGARLTFVRGFDAVEKYPTPRDTEIPFFDEEEDYLYIKRTDSNGSSSVDRFKLIKDPIPKFDPDRYVSVEQFDSLRKEVQDGFASIQKSIDDAFK